ncbi:MAG: AmmeMemoRadiSam system protein B [Candidatus Omnitrophota bacterium]
MGYRYLIIYPMFLKIISQIVIVLLFFSSSCLASIKLPDFAGQFYPDEKERLSVMIDNFLEKASPKDLNGRIFALISPHAGYGYSGQTAAFGYKLIKNKLYKTVIILGTSHRKAFAGAAVYEKGTFLTSLGEVAVDDEFIKTILGKDPEVFADEAVFKEEHSVEVQLPFLQKVLDNFKIVPVVIGDCSLESCKNIAGLLKEAIGKRKDILIVVSSDMYHGYDPEEAVKADAFTLDLIKKLDYEKLYYSLRDGSAQACGGFAIVIALDLAKKKGFNAKILSQTNSAQVTGSAKGEWTVGYASCAIVDPEGEDMLNQEQKKKLLKLARNSIETYLKTGKKLEVNENDPVLNKNMGAFVTLNKGGDLRGCIGNLVGNQPIYLTVRDMAVEAAVDDPRFSPLSLKELKEVEIEISVLSPLVRVKSADEIELGKHGVLVRKGARSGVFLPQVATETGWGKEEFLDNLCSHKAGLPESSWKDKDTEIYIFSAEVFSEEEIGE